MQIITDQKQIKRKKLIGQITTFAGLGVLAVGFYFSMKPETMNLSFGALILGFILTQIAVYYGNRWGKSPRQDELVVKALKGLDKSTSLYNFTSPVSHLLVGPMGVWILLPYFQEGTITYDEKKNRWRQKSGNWYMRFFGQGGVGRPDQDVTSNRAQLARFFKKNLPADQQPVIHTALIFTSRNVTVNAETAPVPTLTLDKAKDFFRRQIKQSPADPHTINAVKDILPQEDR